MMREETLSPIVGRPPQSVTFQSILFAGKAPDAVRPDATPPRMPDFFTNLNLDQIVDSLTAGREEYDLKPYFYAPLADVEEIEYRHEVFRDLQHIDIVDRILVFVQKMREMRVHLALSGKLRYRLQKERLLLDAAVAYGAAVQSLATELSGLEVASRGLRGFHAYLADYVTTAGFTSLVAEAGKVKVALSEVKYCLGIDGPRVRVSKYDAQEDYSAQIDATFAKFKQAEAKDYRVRYADGFEMDHVEANAVDLVARLYPETFGALHSFCERYGDFADETIGTFDREIQFYLAYLEYVQRITGGGLAFCYPKVSDQSKEINAHDIFDTALADKLVQDKAPIVCNDFSLNGAERIFVVSGPNQGGKTTFARAFGQLHYLGSIGCLVPGTGAHLYLPDRLFTHFEREEDLVNLSGKLQDELVRVHDILDRATSRSIVIMNEIFTSTTLHDALSLGTKIMEQIVSMDLLCVCVTFVDELASLSDTTVSLVSTIVPENPTLRTFKIERRPADGLAYAAVIAKKHGLTYELLKERLAS